jgi:hypothetical protein
VFNHEICPAAQNTSTLLGCLCPPGLEGDVGSRNGTAGFGNAQARDPGDLFTGGGVENRRRSAVVGVDSGAVNVRLGMQ